MARKHKASSKYPIDKKERYRNTVGSFTYGEFYELCDLYGNVCLCCGKKKKLTADHIIPLMKLGTHTMDNIQPLCKKCNSRKNSAIIDYRANPPIVIERASRTHDYWSWWEIEQRVSAGDTIMLRLFPFGIEVDSETGNPVRSDLCYRERHMLSVYEETKHNNETTKKFIACLAPSCLR